MGAAYVFVCSIQGMIKEVSHVHLFDPHIISMLPGNKIFQAVERRALAQRMFLIELSNGDPLACKGGVAVSHNVIKVAENAGQQAIVSVLQSGRHQVQTVMWVPGNRPLSQAVPSPYLMRPPVPA